MHIYIYIYIYTCTCTCTCTHIYINVFVGGLGGQQLARLTLQGQRIVGEETIVKQQGRIRDVRQGPEGYIYIAVEARGGAPTPILRLEPMSEEERPH